MAAAAQQAADAARKAAAAAQRQLSQIDVSQATSAVTKRAEGALDRATSHPQVRCTFVQHTSSAAVRQSKMHMHYSQSIDALVSRHAD